MKRKAVSGIMLMLLTATMFNLMFNTGIVIAQEQIYIRPNGSVDPSTAPITRAGNTYTFTANISKPIVIQKDNIVMDGNGYVLHGAGERYGFSLDNRINVTIRKTHVTGYNYGIHMNLSTSNTVTDSFLENNVLSAVWLESSTKTNITNNDIANNYCGILLTWSDNNNITSNAVKNNPFGIWILGSNGNTVKNNTIANNNVCGIWLDQSSTTVYFNNFINNTAQAVTSNSINAWNSGYPSGGNYWSDYTDVDLKKGPNQDQPGSDGIGDTPYVIDAGNRDRYPLMNIRGIHDIAVTDVKPRKAILGQGYSMCINVTVANQGGFTETFNVTTSANTTTIQIKTVTLEIGAYTTITFTWNTAGFAKGNYTIKAYATPVPGETDTTDNTFTDGLIMITIPGDVDGDKDVDLYDVVKICSVYGSKKGDPGYQANYDVNCDEKIDLYDAVIACTHYGQKDP